MKTNQNKRVRVIAKGYHPELDGVFITKGWMPPDLSLDVGVRAIARVYEDFAFLTECDKMRAWANAITIGLKLGGVLTAHAPIQYAEAPVVGCGKSYLQDTTAAFYGEVPYLATAKTRGVGGLEESVAQGMISGKAIIKVDNIVGEFDSQYLAAAVTHDRITARVPYRRETEVDPRRHTFMLNSNGAVMSPDLLRRFSLVRLQKRPTDFVYSTYKEGDCDLLSHVRARQSFYLGCIFSVIREWILAGKPQTRERRHSFTRWAQSLDWIVRNIFGMGLGLFDDYGNDGQPLPALPREVGFGPSDMSLFMTSVPGTPLQRLSGRLLD
jgi:hypothetical protein